MAESLHNYSRTRIPSATTPELCSFILCAPGSLGGVLENMAYTTQQDLCYRTAVCDPTLLFT